MKTALILIDIQNDYFPGGKMELEAPLPAAQHARRLLDTYPSIVNVDASVLAATIDALSDCAQACTADADDNWPITDEGVAVGGAFDSDTATGMKLVAHRVAGVPEFWRP